VEAAILLALAASFCIATSSVCQRLGAREAGSSGFDVYLLFKLVRQPIWVLGLLSMILGFILQISALRFGALALVWVALPFWSTHKPDGSGNARLATGVGIFLVCYLVVFTLLGYFK